MCKVITDLRIDTEPAVTHITAPIYFTRPVNPCRCECTRPLRALSSHCSATWYKLRSVEDDAGRQDSTSPQCKGCRALVLSQKFPFPWDLEINKKCRSLGSHESNPPDGVSVNLTVFAQFSVLSAYSSFSHSTSVFVIVRLCRLTHV